MRYPDLANAVVTVVAVAAGSTLAEAQYRPELFAGPTIGRIHSPDGNATVAGLNLGFGIGLGGQSVLVGPEAFLLDGGVHRVRAFAIAARLRQRVGTLHPHLLVSVGTYAWQTKRVLTLPEFTVLGDSEWRETDYFSGSIGAGLTFGGLEAPVSGAVEARWHRNLGRTEAAGSRSLLALTAGVRLIW